MDQEEIHSRINWLIGEIFPLTMHDDLVVSPQAYDKGTDTFHLDVMPQSAPLWADTAYHFAKGAKYDNDYNVHGIDGQPRVSYSGLVWVRYISDFLDGSRVAFHVWSKQPSHKHAEQQLSNLYGLFQGLDDLEPIEVFRKFMFNNSC